MRRISGVLVVLLIAAVSAYQYLSATPDFPPPATVVGMPPSSSSPLLAPYAGKHPSLIGRPAEVYTFPIPLGGVGPVETLFSGPPQYPFLCGVRASGLGQPLVDNQQGWGVPVYAVDKQGDLIPTIVGYSKDCLMPTRADYFYNRVGTRKFYPLSEANNDIAQTEVNGQLVDFIVRTEVGIINRYFYVLMALKGADEAIDAPNGSSWNKKLIYQFRGGVGIGYRQGRSNINKLFERRFEQLGQGYAVAFSSGNQTSNHYNLWLAEDTALRVKKQFVALYGKPQYTIGIGGSGGAIQQYVLAQNNPNILDAAIAEYSYPDMLTQTTYALDCELLEYYFDVVDVDNQRWRDWNNRQLIEGMNASDEGDNKFQWFHQISQFRAGVWPEWDVGDTECVQGWRGLSPLINNPRYAHFDKYFAPDVAGQVRWSHWNDVQQIYGTDEQGYGRSTWDNVGVQYGLEALREGQLSMDEFLKLNASVGGWKPPAEMSQEKFWFYIRGNGYFPVRVSLWSHHNMRLGDLQQPAQRTEGDIEAMKAAYRSGIIFLGKLNIPVIDLRHYLEPELNMHHLSASFSVRRRMLREQGHSDNMVIWVTKKPHSGEQEAFAALDQWLLNIARRPNQDWLATRPKHVVDQCFNRDGEVIAAGGKVWDGVWNGRPAGACSQHYPSYSVSRQQAGADVAGDVLKCQLQTVTDAMGKGLYGVQDVSSHMRQLETIFPQGVCDYSLADSGRPQGLLVAQQPLLVERKAIIKAELKGKVERAGLLELSMDDQRQPDTVIQRN